MNEEQIRAIVKDEMARNFNSGTPKIPPHSHTGIDGIRINSVDIVGFQPIPSRNAPYQVSDGTTVLGFANAKLLQESGAVLTGNKGALYPLPIVFADGGLSGFQGGYAPNGTIVLFKDPLQLGAAQLWALINEEWYGVNLSTTP